MALKPVNVTEETRWNISSTLQRFPYEVYDQIVAEGTRKISVCGYVPAVHVGKPDEPNLIRCRRRIKVV